MSTEKIRAAIDDLVDIYRERMGSLDGMPTIAREALLEVAAIERQGAKPRRWVCTACRRQFIDEASLVRHLDSKSCPAGSAP